MPPKRGSVRRQVRISRPAAAVWAIAGDPARLAEWWPGIEAVEMGEGVRTVTTGAGISIREEIVTVDPVDRRLQYRIEAPFVTEHLSTLDVVDLGDGTCLALYSVDAVPATMALVIAGAGGSGLERLKSLLERAGGKGGDGI